MFIIVVIRLITFTYFFPLVCFTKRCMFFLDEFFFLSIINNSYIVRGPELNLRNVGDKVNLFTFCLLVGHFSVSVIRVSILELVTVKQKFTVTPVTGVRVIRFRNTMGLNEFTVN